MWKIYIARYSAKILKKKQLFSYDFRNGGFGEENLSGRGIDFGEILLKIKGLLIQEIESFKGY
jgi:hypothetical protein